jgi:hypothetical protein
MEFDNISFDDFAFGNLDFGVEAPTRGQVVAKEKTHFSRGKLFWVTSTFLSDFFCNF